MILHWEIFLFFSSTGQRSVPWSLVSTRIYIGYDGVTGTQIEAMQIMRSVLRDDAQVPNLQKSLPDQLVRNRSAFIYSMALRVSFFTPCRTPDCAHTHLIPRENDSLGVLIFLYNISFVAA